MGAPVSALFLQRRRHLAADVHALHGGADPGLHCGKRRRQAFCRTRLRPPQLLSTLRLLCDRGRSPAAGLPSRVPPDGRLAMSSPNPVVSSWNEWDPLEEILVGSADHAAYEPTEP